MDKTAETNASLRHGVLEGQDLSLLTAGDALSFDGEDIFIFERLQNDDEDKVVGAWLTRLGEGGPTLHPRPEAFVFIGHGLGDGWIAAPEGGWTSNPVPGMRVDVRFPDGEEEPATRSDFWSMQPEDWWKSAKDETCRIIAFRLAPTPDQLPGKSGEAGPAEAEVGRAVYERIAALVDGNPVPRSSDWAELDYLSHLAKSVEEIGGYDGPLCPLATTQPAEQSASSLVDGEARIRSIVSMLEKVQGPTDSVRIYSHEAKLIVAALTTRSVAVSSSAVDCLLDVVERVADGSLTSECAAVEVRTLIAQARQPEGMNK